MLSFRFLLCAALSFGTETRVSPSGHFVPPNPGKYNYLRFKADEISDLTVINPLPADPAIIGGESAPLSAAAPEAPAAAPAAAPRAAAAAAPRRAPAAAPPPAPSAAPWSKGAVSGAAVVATGAGRTGSSGSGSAGGAPVSRRPGPGPAYTAGPSSGRGGGRGGRAAHTGGGSRDDLLNTALEPERGSGGRGGRGGARGGARGGHGGHSSAAAASAASDARAGDGAALLGRRTLGADREHRPAAVAGSYDFESANARFHKLDGEGEGAGGAGESEIPSFALKTSSADADADGGAGGGAGGEDKDGKHGAYKKDDFFDELTTENSHTRLRWAEERK